MTVPVPAPDADSLAAAVRAALADPGGDPWTRAQLLASLAVLQELRAQRRLLESLAEAGGWHPAAGADAPAEPGAGGDEAWRRLGLNEGERRVVTVLFADVSGFTAMAERMDPEECEAVMKETMAELSGVIRRHDGYVEKFIGDAICAIFGAPFAHEDEPERAARTALELHELLAARAAARPDLPALTVHIGLNTGLVIAGTVGDGSQFGVMGDTINTAARLMDKASSGQTFVSAETARRLRRCFLVEDVGTLPMKGKRAPVPAFNVLRELDADERAEAAPLRAPFVGRDDDLASLESAAQGVERSGRGAAVLVVGDAGIGKSRLLEELTTRLADTFTVLRAAARVHGARPNGVMADALGRLLDRVDGHEAHALRALLEDDIRVPDDLEVTLTRMLLAQAAERPIAVILDDFEFADPGSSDLFRYLARGTADGAVLWVLATRPGAVAFDALAMEGPSITRTRLRPLTTEAVGRLLDGLLPGALDDRQRARLAARCEGNPEFAEEIALALVDDGTVVESSGRWTVVGDLDSLQLPGTVQELIEARIQGLSDAARVTLQHAAAIGVRFGKALLRSIVDDPRLFEAGLDDLLTAELVRRPAADDPEGFHSFRSPLVREVAYGTILRRHRPELHRKVAEGLLALEPEREDELAELLAHHFEAAGDAARAVRHLRVASAHAEAALSFAAAAELAGRALSLHALHPGMVPDDDAALLFERRGVCHTLLNDPVAADADLRAAIDLHRALGHVEAEARIEDKLGWYLVLAHRVPEGLGHASEAEALAARHGVTAVAVSAEVTRQLAAAATGNLERPHTELPELVTKAREAGDAFGHVKAALVLGIVTHLRGETAAAVERLRDARDLAGRHRLAMMSRLAGTWLVHAELDAGLHGHAAELAAELLAHAEEAGDRPVQSSMLAALARLHRELGDLTGAAALAERSLAQAAQHQQLPGLVAAALVEQAACDVDAGRLATAMERISGVPDLLDADSFLAWRLGAHYEIVRARAALSSGDAEGALLAVEHLRRRLGGAAARRERAMASWLEAEGRSARLDDDAASAWDRAIDDARGLAAPFLTAHVQLSAAGRLRGRDHALSSAARAVEAIAAAAPPELASAFAGGPLVAELRRLQDGPAEARP